MKPPTILTNLQRGNVRQESPMVVVQRSLHELAALGELYSMDPEYLEYQDSNGLTPLQWAAAYGQNRTVEVLLAMGANPNHKSACGATALMYAVEQGFIYVVKALIRGGANVDEQDDFGNTALIFATMRDHHLIVEELLKRQANLGIVNVGGLHAYSIALTRQRKLAQAAIEAHILNVLNLNSIEKWL